MIRTALAVLALTAAAAAPAMAQDYSLPPTYGTVNLAAGFQPDPVVVPVVSGGMVSASGIDSSCMGSIATAPDVRLNYSAGGYPLIISVNSSADTTLVVNGPDGTWYCDDDGGLNGLNPGLIFEPAMSGQYDIWVGSYSQGTNSNADVYISEVGSQ